MHRNIKNVSRLGMSPLKSRTVQLSLVVDATAVLKLCNIYLMCRQQSTIPFSNPRIRAHKLVRCCPNPYQVEHHGSLLNHDGSQTITPDEAVLDKCFLTNIK